MNLIYIEKLKNEILNKYSKNNIYYKYLNKINYYQNNQKCLICNKKSYNLHNSSQIVCSVCGKSLSYLDDLPTSTELINYILSKYNSNQKKNNRKRNCQYGL